MKEFGFTKKMWTYKKPLLLLEIKCMRVVILQSSFNLPLNICLMFICMGESLCKDAHAAFLEELSYSQRK